MSAEAKIAVVGAGMGGLAAAGALRKVGFDVEVYEQASRFGRVGAGIQVTPNSLKALDGIGAGEEARRRGFETYSQLSRNGETGEFIRELVMDPDEFGAEYLCMHRADLHASLLTTVPDESIHLGKKLAGLDNQADGVRLSFEDGTTASADAVIGADGMHSLVRELIVGKVEATYSGRAAYRSVIPIERLDREYASSRTMWITEDRHLLIYPLVRDKSEICFASGQADEGKWITKESWSAQCPVEEAMEAFSNYHEDVLAFIGAATFCHKTGMSTLQPLERWSDGRVALLGDAAHTMPPLLAQGAAMAIEDASILARALEGGSSIEDGFALYEGHRKPRTTLLWQIASDRKAAGRRGDKDMGWMYGYDAWQVPYDRAPDQPGSVAEAV